MYRLNLLPLAIVVTLGFATQLPTARAAFTTAGNIDPTTDPSTWTSSTIAYIGKSAGGSLTVDGGNGLNSSSGYIGYNSGSTGVVTVSGANSTWTDSDFLDVGQYGNGALNIGNGGAVSVGAGTYVGLYAGSTGAINFLAGGGTLTTSGLSASPTQLKGAGTIIAHGIVSDI